MYKQRRRRQDLASRSACATRSRFPPSSWTRATPTASSWPLSGIPTAPMPSAASFAPLDGGQTWKKVLYKDEHTGAVDLAFDPRKSADGLRRAVAVAPGALGERRVLRAGQRPVQIHRRRRHLEASSPAACRRSREGWDASASAWRPAIPTASTPWWRPSPTHGGLYRSDDAGATWRRVNHENRIWGRGDDFAGVRVDPKNRDVVYVANTSTYRSTDAGETFTAIKGAPGGDDYHTIWINPEQSRHHPAGRRPGRDPQRELRPHLEFLVQPADGAVLSRHHRQPVSLLGLWRAAGKRIGGHRQPRQRRRHHLSRMAPRGRRGIRLPSRPIRSTPISFTAAAATA